jgi:sulfur carrier protein
MKVLLRNPRREVEVPGGRRVKDILRELNILPETVLVIRGDTMVTADQVVADNDVIELRPVMSGGADDRRVAGSLQASRAASGYSPPTGVAGSRTSVQASRAASGYSPPTGVAGSRTSLQ